MNQEERTSTFKWILYVIIVPAIFAITIFVIFLSFTGVDVAEKAKDTGKKIPFIKNIWGENAVSTASNSQDVEKQWQSKFKEQEDYIKILNSDLQKKEKEVSDLKSDVALLEKQTEEVETTVKDEKNVQLKKLYESMSAKDASAVLSEMNNADILQILSLLKPETQAEILSKLEPKRAAEITELIASDSL
ncbi:MotE family protein [Bacillus sp. NEB1478]|uniref:MotE family protein n=1 Tax=Bacillus sp. NEB1478 TaxID=3073816 RepID=UPI002873D45D|nr:MotE family protein [Bacillus sp. NEB1478]WNB90401.1 MotE family protein [Bacillus sp. NEB1478]